jgi:hypothetical protein
LTTPVFILLTKFKSILGFLIFDFAYSSNVYAKAYFFAFANENGTLHAKLCIGIADRQSSDSFKRSVL